MLGAEGRAAGRGPERAARAVRPRQHAAARPMSTGRAGAARPGAARGAACSSRPFDVAASRELREGLIWPQSRASMLPARMLGPSPGCGCSTCARRPGGKTGQLAALMEDRGELVCVERHPGRAEALRGTLGGWASTCARVEAADALEFAEGGFDRILLDPPCSGLGVLAGRPDARWRRTLEGAAEVADLQRADARPRPRAARPGGRLVYSVCTIRRDECEGVAPRRPADAAARDGTTASTWRDRVRGPTTPTGERARRTAIGRRHQLRPHRPCRRGPRETVRILGLLGFDCGKPGTFSGEWIDRIIGLEDVTVEVVMARGPDGSDVFEVVRFHSPSDGAQGRRRPRTVPGSGTSPSRSTTCVASSTRPRGRLGNGRGDRRLREHVPALLRPRTRRPDRRARRAAQPRAGLTRRLRVERRVAHDRSRRRSPRHRA